MAQYAIDDGDSNLITSGLTGYSVARHAAQRIANERGEPVYLYELSAHDADSDDAPSTVEIMPEAP